MCHPGRRLLFARCLAPCQNPQAVNDSRPMATAREIIDRHDLADIHEHGVGFVLYPFGRKLHSASCPTVPGMALNPKEPRWFAPDAVAARKYQADRLARNRNAQPYGRVRCCASLVPENAVVGATGADRPSPPTRTTTESLQDGSGEGRVWTSRTQSRSVELWTTRRIPFETDQSAQQKAMVRELAQLAGSLRCESHERLHGVFISDETSSRQPDAENITFYNFGSALFSGADSVLAFERSYAEAPRPPRPLEAPARYYHVWSVVAENVPFEHWIEGDTVATWNEVPFDLTGDLGLAAWRALREHPERVTVVSQLGMSDHYGIDVTLTAPDGKKPSIVKAVKGLVDGPLAGLQRADHLEPDVVSRLLERRWGRPIDESALVSLVSAAAPPPLLPRAPFNKNGLDPCDELCVAGTGRIVATSGPAVLTGKVFRMVPR